MSVRAPYPDKLFNCNVYDDGNKLVGVANEITMPKLTSMSDTLSGVGILGEMETPTPGHYGSSTIGFSWRTVSGAAATLADGDTHTLIIRGAHQRLSDTQSVTAEGLKVTVRVISKELDLGKLSPGSPTGTASLFEVMYLKVEVGGTEILELDKLNYVYRTNGVDKLAKFTRHM